MFITRIKIHEKEHIYCTKCEMCLYVRSPESYDIFDCSKCGTECCVFCCCYLQEKNTDHPDFEWICNECYSPKKLKLEVEFNVIHELYLNNENRDILQSVLGYISRDERKTIIESITGDPLICENCYNHTNELSSMACSIYDRDPSGITIAHDMFHRNLMFSYLFCKSCKDSHMKIHTFIKYVDEVAIYIGHDCKLYTDLFELIKERFPLIVSTEGKTYFDIDFSSLASNLLPEHFEFLNMIKTSKENKKQ